jgi:hypothetical protein
MANLLREYNAGVNQATATSNAQLAQALYNEMIRQEKLAAAQAAAQAEAERYQREWDYKVKQDELDRQLAYDQLAAKRATSSSSNPKSMSLSTAKAMAEAGQLTDEVVNALIGAGYNAEYIASEYGYTPMPIKETGNQGLSKEQIITLQKDLNKYLPAGQKLAEDGVWGPSTQAAAGGFTAREYANEYYRQNSWSGRSDR